MSKQTLSAKLTEILLQTLQSRFEKNMHRHKGIRSEEVSSKLQNHAQALWSLYEMGKTGGDPDVIGYDKKIDVYTFCDCSEESPKDRRGLCYDRQALEERKQTTRQCNRCGNRLWAWHVWSCY